MNYKRIKIKNTILPFCFLICSFLYYFVFMPSPHISSYPNQPSNEVIVLFDPSVDVSMQLEILSQYDSNLTLLEQIDNYVLCKYPNSQNISNFIHKLNKNPNILIAEANSELLLNKITDDPYSESQWPLKNDGFYYQITDSNKTLKSSTTNIDLNIPKAWAVTASKETSNKEVIIAILDTGVDINHPDLIGRIWTNPFEIPGDGIDNDKNGYIDDTVGWDFYNNDRTVCHYQYDSSKNAELASSVDNDNHGTHIAGIIAANANNKIGIAGVSSNINVKIMPLKIHGGINGKGTIANAIKAIKYATMMGADICNMSWGSTNYSEALKTAMKESTMLFVTAAGNTGTDNDITPLYPANYELDNQISVSFIDGDGRLTPDSNYGLNTVDIVAPGTNIISTIVGSYATMSGSSMAAPHVSAIAAMLYSYGNNVIASNVKNIITNNIKPINGLENVIKYPGIPNAAAIVASADELLTDITLPNIDFLTKYDKDRILVQVNTSDLESGVRTVQYTIGNRSTDYFMRGTSGLSIQDNILSLAKAGTYTFYVSDYAGNEVTKTYEVLDDLQAPTIRANYKVSNDYSSITISTTITDTQSGIKTVKYAEGVKTIDSFRAIDSGTVIRLENDSFVLKVKNPNKFTIYAQDYRGNKSITYVNARIIKSINLKLNRSNKVLGVGKSFRLWPTLSPKNSTDQVTYKTSNPEVVTVNKWGLLNGVSPGVATVTATTSSGISKTCIITVKQPVY